MPKNPLVAPNFCRASTLQIFFPGCEVETMENAFSTERVNPAACDCRCCARAFVEAKIVSIPSGIVEGPHLPSGLGVETLHDFPIAHAVKENQPAASTTGGLKPWPTLSSTQSCRLAAHRCRLHYAPVPGIAANPAPECFR